MASNLLNEILLQEKAFMKAYDGRQLIIETLIVITFIVAFLKLAIPAADDFLIKKQVSIALSNLIVAKRAVAMIVAKYDRLPINQDETGYVSPVSDISILSIEIANDGTGVITLTTTSHAGDGTIIFTPTIKPGRKVDWDCSAGTLEDRYRPPDCL